MENKYILCNDVHKHIREKAAPHLSKKNGLEITKNDRGITRTKMLCFSTLSNLKSRKFFVKIRMAFGKIDPELLRFRLSAELPKDNVQKILG